MGFGVWEGVAWDGGRRLGADDGRMGHAGEFWSFGTFWEALLMCWRNAKG